MLLTPMRFKNYIWPHNPTTYSITYERQIAVHKVPFGRFCMQDLGMGCRVMRGEGEFAGEGAYEEFKRLASVFYGGEPGLLIHPVWQSANAYFTALRLEQQPLPDYVRYSFEFRERYDGYEQHLTEIAPAQTPAPIAETVTHSVSSGETLWAIAHRYGTTTEAILASNPALKNPNLIGAGDKVVIPC